MIVGAGFVSAVPFTVTFNAVVLRPFGTMMSREPFVLGVPVTVKFRLFGVELIWVIVALAVVIVTGYSVPFVAVKVVRVGTQALIKG